MEFIITMILTNLIPATCAFVTVLGVCFIAAPIAYFGSALVMSMIIYCNKYNTTLRTIRRSVSRQTLMAVRNTTSVTTLKRISVTAPTLKIPEGHVLVDIRGIDDEFKAPTFLSTQMSKAVCLDPKQSEIDYFEKMEEEKDNKELEAWLDRNAN